MPDTPSLDQSYLDAIKGFEGYQPKASWDYKQYTNGYGTKATHSGEVIDRDTAEQRFQSEIGKAAGSVDAAFPQLPTGARAALTSLTYNAGPGWINSGLGNAVRQGDWGNASNLFQQYTNAGGQPSPGLANRRAQEATWLTGAQQPGVSPLLNASSLGAQSTPAGVPLYGGQQQGAQPQQSAMDKLAQQLTTPAIPFPTQPFQFAPMQPPAPLPTPAPMQFPQMALLRRPT